MNTTNKIETIVAETEKYQNLLNDFFSANKQTQERACTQVIEENYDEGSFLWQSLSHLYSNPQLTEQMQLHPQSESYILLAAFLSKLEKMISPDISLFHSLVATLNQDKTLRFCISGEATLDGLKIILEHQKDHAHLLNKK